MVPARSQGGDRGQPEAAARRQPLDLLSRRAVQGRRRGDRRRQAAAGREGELGQGLVRRPDAGRAGRRRQGQARDLGEEPDRHARLVLLEQGRQGGRGALRKRPRRRRVDRRGWHGGRRQPGRRRPSLPDDAGRDIPPVGLDARREGSADRDLPDPAGFLLVARARARERSCVRRAGDRRLRRVGQAREGAAVSRANGARSATASTSDRGGLRWVDRHARHDARAQAVVHVPRVPRGRLRDLSRRRAHCPIRRARTRR